MILNTIFIDTNMINEDGSYYIPDVIIRKRGYLAGDIVTAYQDTDAWKAKIVNTDGTWGVELLSEAEQISDDRYEGHQEGFAEGVLVQNLAIIRVLQDQNVSEDIIEAVKCKLDMV